MNAGLTNLATLKGWLLPASLIASTEYDAQIAAIGKGVLGQLEKFCNRKFARVEGDIFECSADRSHLVLARYPVEAITTLEQSDDAGVWETLDEDDILQSAKDRGMIFFGAQMGTFLSRLRVTYTGGYWFEDKEPTDDGYPTTPPDGSTAVPDELLMAWKLQCENVWKIHDKLGLAIGEAAGGGSGALLGLSLPGLQTVPLVTDMLRPFIRYSLY